jgi:tRNA(Ile)-lysidine synthase
VTALAAIVATLERGLAPELAAADAQFLVGFSGGADSTVLLAALSKRVHRDRLSALHVDHGIHADSAAWAHHCRTVGAAFGVRVDVHQAKVAPGSNLEERARRVRYAAFVRLLPAGCTLLLAHHADDQAETVLLRLVTGRLLRGMPARRALGAGTLVRPLLDVPRARLHDAARELGLEWLDDPANRDMAFDRNFLRHDVLPRLRRRWPDVGARIAAQAERLARESALGRAALDAALDAAGEALPLDLLRRAPSMRLLVRRFLERHGVAGVSESALAEFERQWAAVPAVEIAVEVVSGVSLRAFSGAMHVVRRAEKGFGPYRWVLPGEVVLGGFRLVATWTGAATVTPTSLTVRPRAGGERLRPAGRGGSRSVKRLLQEARVPTHLRTGYPLLYEGERLVVVPGVAVDESAADRFATARSGGRDAFLRIEIERTREDHRP